MSPTPAASAMPCPRCRFDLRAVLPEEGHSDQAVTCPECGCESTARHVVMAVMAGHAHHTRWYMLGMVPALGAVAVAPLGIVSIALLMPGLAVALGWCAGLAARRVRHRAGFLWITSGFLFWLAALLVANTVIAVAAFTAMHALGHRWR